jgi:hypothetical protein
MRYNEIELLQNLLGGTLMGAVKRFALIVFAVLGVLLIGGLVVAFIFHVLSDVLYVILIILALLMIASVIFTIYSVVQLIRTFRTVQNEVKPLLASVQETVGIVKTSAQTAGQTVSTIGETAKLTSAWAVAPAISSAAALIATGGVMRTFFGKGRVRTRAEQRRKEQMEAVRQAREAAARGES